MKQFNTILFTALVFGPLTLLAQFGVGSDPSGRARGDYDRAARDMNRDHQSQKDGYGGGSGCSSCGGDRDPGRQQSNGDEGSGSSSPRAWRSIKDPNLINCSSYHDEAGTPISNLMNRNQCNDYKQDLLAELAKKQAKGAPAANPTPAPAPSPQSGPVEVPQVRNANRFHPDVFNPIYYGNHYGDLKSAFGMNAGELENHWDRYGINECRNGRNDFNPCEYLANYEDLQKAFGNNKDLAIAHWIEFGKKEGRSATTHIKQIKDRVEQQRQAAAANPPVSQDYKKSKKEIKLKVAIAKAKKNGNTERVKKLRKELSKLK